MIFDALRYRCQHAAVATLALLVALCLSGTLAGCAQPGNTRAGSADTSAVNTGQLASWRDGPTRQAIVKFVREVTTEGHPNYVPPHERIAVFDNDGTLWSEQPLYFQLIFMVDQVRAQASAHPEWKRNPAFAPLMRGDYAALDTQRKPLLQLLAAANSGMDTDEYDRRIRDWLANARHPQFGRPYTELVFQPQQELLAYLRANGFRTYIVSGGETDFMRPWAPTAYGIPPEQIIGTQGELKYVATRDGDATLVRQPKVDFLNDGPGKPVAIHRVIGHRPILAVGNSDGDLQMLEYTTSGNGPHLALLVHHDDAAREFAYDRKSKIGKLDRAWDAAIARGWTVISMKDDWATVFASPRP